MNTKEKAPFDTLLIRELAIGDKAKAKDRRPREGGPSSLERSMRAMDGVLAFAAGDEVSEPAETIISDLLGNLMHLCRLGELDFDKTLARAKRNFDAETD